MTTPSALVADRYRLVKMLGAGGMGIVWQAWDTRLRRPVALKMLRTQPELTDEERQVATDRAMREAQITAGLHHPHAVTVFDVVEHEDQPCIVMQLLESTPLSELLREHGTFSPAQTARIGAQVASALAAAHELKIVHRDVKPGNILITADGSARISDFGISHALGDATVTATGVIHGTPAFLAPEVARGLPTSFASDVFSLGSTLYTMVEGEPPFGSDRNSIALLHRVAKGGYPAPKHAADLAPLLRRMLAPQPKRRPTMAAVAGALAAFPQEPAVDGDVARGLIALGFDATTVGTPTADVVGDRPDDPPDGPATDAAPAVSPAVGPEPLPPTPPTIPAWLLGDEETAGPGAAPAVQSTARLPTRPTVPVDRPTRYEAPTAETEPLRPAASATTAAATPQAADPGEATDARVPQQTRRGRTAILVGLLILVAALGLGAAFLLIPAADDGQVAGPAASRTAEATPSESRTPTATPEPEAPEPEPPEPTAEEAPAPAPVAPEQRVVDTIAGYYAMMPADRDSAWPLMTADYQENHAGGRGGYEAFWSGVSDVTVAEVIATGPDAGQATLTYYFADGRVVDEVTAYRFVDDGGVLKIAATEVLSSAER